jgi:chitin disaccharide deacetylase
MCHPGFVDDRLRAIDAVTDQRRTEYDYFASDRFPRHLAAAGVHLARFGDIHPPAPFD